MKIEVFGRNGCALCESTKHKLSHFVEKWGHSAAVELTFVDMETEDGLAEGAFRDVVDIPTTIASADGREVARWERGVPGSEEVKRALERCGLTQSK